MHRLARRVSAFLVGMAAFCGLLSAQSTTITLRMLDSKTGKLIETTSYLVRVNRDPTVHANWVVQNEDGTGRLTLPPGSSLIAIHATYDNSMLTYINCGADGGKANSEEHWFSLAEILSTGIVVPNGCKGKLGSAAKVTPAAKPGELIFFVRKLNMREQMHQDYEPD